MGWNYRVVKDRGGYTIREAFYDDRGRLEGYTGDGVAAYGETREELLKNLEQMVKAFKKPIIEVKEWP